MDVIDVADFFIDTANDGDPEEDDGVTNMKLNKLLFFAQAASLQRFNKPLFDAPLEAWQYGPVVRSVYQEFKPYGRNPIAATARPFDWRELTGEEKDLLCDVYLAYARNHTALSLMDMTHAPGSPWSQVYDPDRNNVIPVPIIREWVAAHPLPIDQKPLTGVVEARLSPDGHPYWPEEWDDD